MAGADLNVFRFDFDLTFAALLMNADGTIYHTYGGRDFTSPVSHLSMESFTDSLRKGLVTHAAHKPFPPGKKGPTVEDLGKRIGVTETKDCYHCHTVNDWLTEIRRKAGLWKQRDVFRWHDPIQVGLRIDGRVQNRIARVEPDSVAERAGMREGDLLTRVGRIDVATFGDIQRGLLGRRAPRRLGLYWRRDGKTMSETVQLGESWDIATPRVFAWRSSKWPLSPKPGFGGNQLGKKQLLAAGFREAEFAFRVTYIVTWGKNAHTGRNAANAGIRKGDLVYSVGSKKDFDSVDHFHAWFRLTRKAGQTVKVKLRRGQRPMVIDLPVVD